MKLLSAWLLTLALTAAVVANASCPFANKPQNQHAKQTPKGHNRPFGHHAKHWKRVHTVYEHPDPETFFNNFVRLSRPLVIKGGAANWPAINKWTNISYINSIGGKERSHVNWKRIYDYDRHHAIRIDMTMKEFTDKFNTHDLYMDATIPLGLHDDVYWPHSLGCRFFLKRMKQLAIMMNNGKSKSDVHIDVTDTYFMQVTGKRLWLMSPPSFAKSIYSGHPYLVDHSGISIINQTHVDLEKHPETSKLDIYAAYLNPGDIVYVPEAWYHQVVTYGSPNIAIVAFMNVLFCEYNAQGHTDASYVHRCVNDVLARKPRKLQCDAFPKENITITELLRRYKPRTLGGFQGYFGTSPTVDRYKRYGKVLQDKSILPAMGMSLTGMTHEALQSGQVLKQGLIEGYKLFCTAPNDGSEDALGRVITKYPRLRKRLLILSYFPIESAAESIHSSLQRLNTTHIDFVLLAAPYCVADYQAGECTRNAFTQSWAGAWRALEELQRAGKIRFLGVSDFSESELRQLVALASVPVTIARARFDLYFRNKKLRHFCKEKGIHFMGRSVLGGRWKEEQPDHPENRNILKEYQVLKTAYQYKISAHAAVYDWAIKKDVIVCPRVNDPLHVRVNIKAIESESIGMVANIEVLDSFDPTDEDGFPARFLPTLREGEKDVDVESREKEGSRQGSTDGKDEDDVAEDDEQAAEKEMRDGVKTSSENFSDRIYTDDMDFESFPRYMLGKGLF